MKIKHLFAASIAAMALYSCSTPKDITYFQDIPVETTVKMAEASQIKLQPEDKLYILVSTPDEEITKLFNVFSSNTISSGMSNSNNGGGIGYTIDKNGNIDFPILGEVHAAGLSRSELAAEIKKELVSHELVKDPTVIVEYRNLMISVLGDVSSPGRYNIDRDHYTILDAIAQAGDLSITGLRKNVTVIRPNGNKQQIYKLDLLSDSALVNSPAYYLHQGDYVYVEPNDMKKRSSTTNGNTLQTPSFWMSVASFVTSMAVLIVNLVK